ncbi:hypothetical protein QTO34_016427 [Cnephaeus nilssonii]|uniref:Murine leukemia virus integrase C-terminal domain-containing protein n=1 Tax=Cnephaeus nilssonii TaxID=3371016 RepID=A0AA40LBR5_CNENI|nr:hypothetical protein QTO34_016427 [Eptesicus nilssonii]
MPKPPAAARSAKIFAGHRKHRSTCLMAVGQQTGVREKMKAGIHNHSLLKSLQALQYTQRATHKLVRDALPVPTADPVHPFQPEDSGRYTVILSTPTAVEVDSIQTWLHQSQLLHQETAWILATSGLTSCIGHQQQKLPITAQNMAGYLRDKKQSKEQSCRTHRAGAAVIACIGHQQQKLPITAQNMAGYLRDKKQSKEQSCRTHRAGAAVIACIVQQQQKIPMTAETMAGNLRDEKQSKDQSCMTHRAGAAVIALPWTVSPNSEPETEASNKTPSRSCNVQRPVCVSVGADPRVACRGLETTRTLEKNLAITLHDDINIQTTYPLTPTR